MTRSDCRRIHSSDPGKRRRNPASHLPMRLEVFTATTQGENARSGDMDR